MGYAIFTNGGRQYRVSPGDIIDVDRVKAEIGSEIELNDVLAVSDGEELTVGQPLVDGVKVIAQVEDHGRGKKIVVFKYKSKVRYRRKKGHRQPYSRLSIVDIVQGKGDS